MKKKLIIEEVFRDAFTLWKKQTSGLYQVLLPLLVVTLLSAFVAGMNGSWVMGVVFGIVLSLAMIYVSLATSGILIGVVRGQRALSLEGFSEYGNTLWKYVAVSFLYSLMIIVGLVLFIIPGIYLAVRYAWVQYAAIENPEKSIGELFGSASDATRGERWSILGLMLLVLLWVAIVQTVVALVFAALHLSVVTEVVSFLVVYPVTLLVPVLAYVHFYPKAGVKESEMVEPAEMKKETVEAIEETKEKNAEEVEDVIALGEDKTLDAA